MTKTTFAMPVLIVNDIDRSRDFYQDLFALEIEYDFGENISFKDSISLWKRERALQIIHGSIESEADTRKHKDLELYFETNDIEGIQASIKERELEMIHDLKEEEWGQRTIRIYDPDRFIIEIAEPMELVVLRYHEKGLPTKRITEKTQMPQEMVKKILKDKEG